MKNNPSAMLTIELKWPTLGPCLSAQEGGGLSLPGWPVCLWDPEGQETAGRERRVMAWAGHWPPQRPAAVLRLHHASSMSQGLTQP